MTPEFTAKSDDKGVITLTKTPPLRWWQRLEKWTRAAVGRLVLVGLGFVAGLVCGWVR